MELDILVGQGKREVFVNVDSSLFQINALGELTLNTVALVDLFYPIGSDYIQFPSAEVNIVDAATEEQVFPAALSPNGKFPGTTWSLITTVLPLSAGAVFRLEGDPYGEGQNHERTDGLQTDQGQGWQLGAERDDAGANVRYGCSGATNFSTDDVPAPGYSIPVLGSGGAHDQGSNQMLKAMNDGTNGTPRTGKETRMMNLLFRVWKRIN